MATGIERVVWSVREEREWNVAGDDGCVAGEVHWIGRGACTEPPGPRSHSARSWQANELLMASGPAHLTRGVVRYAEPPRGRCAAAPDPNWLSAARSSKHLYSGGQRDAWDRRPPPTARGISRGEPLSPDGCNFGGAQGVRGIGVKLRVFVITQVVWVGGRLRWTNSEFSSLSVVVHRVLPSRDVP